jgi:hypothetical protein
VSFVNHEFMHASYCAGSAKLTLIAVGHEVRRVCHKAVGVTMTITQLHLFNGIYLVVLAAVAILTRATPRRIIGALVGATVGGVVALGIITLGEKVGWWHMVITWEPYFLTILLIGFAIGGFVFLITWRVARRFGWRGLAVATVVAAVIGPPRDYWYMKRFPEWGHYGPGIAPLLAVSATYVLLGVIGHAVMRLIAGPARDDRLVQRPWESKQRSTGDGSK